MKTTKKTNNETEHDKAPLNPLGIVMLVLILLPATYGVLRLVGIDLSDVLVQIIRSNDLPQPTAIPAMLSGGLESMMQRYETKASVSELVERYRRSMKEAGYESVKAQEEPPTDKKWHRLLEKNGRMYLTFERDSKRYNVFAEDKPDGGSVVVSMTLSLDMMKKDSGDIPGVVVFPDSQRHFSIYRKQDDSWLADYHSEKGPLELAAWIKGAMIAKGWVCEEKESEQIQAQSSARALVFENSTRRCMICIHQGRKGGSDITISNMKLFAK